MITISQNLGDISLTELQPMNVNVSVMSKFFNVARIAELLRHSACNADGVESYIFQIIIYISKDSTQIKCCECVLTALTHCGTSSGLPCVW